MAKEKVRLSWGGNIEAQKQADEAWSKLQKARKARISAREYAKALKAQRKADAKRRRKGLPPQPARVNYEEYMRSAAWKKRRAAYLGVAGHKCERCGCGTHLHVHHKHYKTLGRERDCDLEVLCGDCHATHHVAEVLGVSPVWLEHEHMGFDGPL